MKEKTRIGYSRQEARKLWKALYWSNMPKEIVVHHKDHNPLKNDLINLTIMEIGEHSSHHLTGRKRSVKQSTIRELGKKLESLLIIFNDR